jgi:hypothetical protein
MVPGTHTGIVVLMVNVEIPRPVSVEIESDCFGPGTTDVKRPSRLHSLSHGLATAITHQPGPRVTSDQRGLLDSLPAVTANNA